MISNKGARAILPMLLLLLSLLAAGCGDSGGLSDDDDNGDDTPPIFTFTGNGNDETGLFRASGGDIAVTITHGENSRFILYFMDNATGRVVNSIIYMNSVTDAVSRFSMPAGDYYMQVDTTGVWSIVIMGNLAAIA